MALAAAGVPSADRLAEGRCKHDRLRAEMTGLQEQLDWEVYAHYGLLDEVLTLPGGEPPLQLGEPRSRSC